MNYLKFGNSKKFLVFLHGWGADLNSFLWTKNYFNNYSLIYVDFAGFGKTPEPKTAWTVFDYAKDLKMLLEQFEIEELILIGHSFGGRVAIKFAKEFQNEYSNLKLCLVDSAGLIPKRNLVYYYRIYKYKFLKKIAKKCKNVKNMLQKQGSSDYIVLSSVMKEVFKNIVNEDLSLDAKQIESQTILVWGEKDKDTKIYMAKKFNKLISNSKLFILKDAGHYSFLEKRDEFLIILDTFVKS